MRTAISLLLLVLSTFLLSFSAFPSPYLAAAPASSEDGIAGHYALSGVNRDGSTYSGSAEISELGGSLYWLEWHDSDGETYTGKGALVGDTLFAVWSSSTARCAVLFLDLVPDGTLNGFWFEAQDRSPQRSHLVARPEADGSGELVGRYSVTAGAIDGSSFPPELRVTALGDGYYRFRWEGEESREGIGLLDADQIQVVVSIGATGGQCGKSQLILDSDGNLAGTWMMNDESFRTLGRETMLRR